MAKEILLLTTREDFKDLIGELARDLAKQSSPFPFCGEEEAMAMIGCGKTRLYHLREAGLIRSYSTSERVHRYEIKEIEAFVRNSPKIYVPNAADAIQAKYKKKKNSCVASSLFAIL